MRRTRSDKGTKRVRFAGKLTDYGKSLLNPVSDCEVVNNCDVLEEYQFDNATNSYTRLYLKFIKRNGSVYKHFAVKHGMYHYLV